MRSTPEGVTKLLERWKIQGDSDAEQELFALVQSELLRIARNTLRKHSGFEHRVEACELVNEAYMALREYPIVTANRGPFFSLMTRAMRHYLMDLADRAQAAKRPPSKFRLRDTDAFASLATEVEPREFYLALDSLRSVNVRQADAIELRIWGLRNDEIAVEQKVSVATVKRDLVSARAFLAFQLGLPANWIHA